MFFLTNEFNQDNNSKSKNLNKKLNALNYLFLSTSNISLILAFLKPKQSLGSIFFFKFQSNPEKIYTTV